MIKTNILTQLYPIDTESIEEFDNPNINDDNINFKPFNNLKSICLMNTNVTSLKFLNDLNYSNIDNITFENNSNSDADTDANIDANMDDNTDADNDIKIISKFHNLIGIGLNNVKLTNLKPFSDLVQIECLHLSNSSISDISDLSKLIKLDTLYVNNNKIDNIETLKYMTNLTSFDISNNNITDFSVLENFVKLIELNIDGDKFFDYPNYNIILNKLKELEYLNLSNTKNYIYKIFQKDQKFINSLNNLNKKICIQFDESEILFVYDHLKELNSKSLDIKDVDKNMIKTYIKNKYNSECNYVMEEQNDIICDILYMVKNYVKANINLRT